MLSNNCLDHGIISGNVIYVNNLYRNSVVNVTIDFFMNDR